MKGCLVDHRSIEHNFIALSPISFLERAAVVHGDMTSLVYGSSLRFSWKETHRRCINLAASLVRLGISRHDVVVAFAPNVPALYELHFAVPMAGGVLSALNFRLDDSMLAVVLRQLEPTFIFVDYEFLEVMVKALYLVATKTKSQESLKIPILILITEPNQKTLHHHNAHQLNTLDYNDLVADHDHRSYFQIVRPVDERDPISVNYTSGSTGNPKGVVYSHRAVYLNSTAVIVNSELRPSSVFLWTVDMFRCNGWCYTWATAAVGATNVCLRSVDLSGKTILEAVARHQVTHLCGKPAILTALASQRLAKPLPSRVEITVAGALPSHETLSRVTEMGFNVSHGYGMTEALGPAVIERWRAEGGRYSNRLLTVEGFDVRDPVTLESVPADGETRGEIMFKGNTLMSGYLGNRRGTWRAYREGWYRTGDVGVRHGDGSVQLVDRVDDVVVVRGGKAVSSLEVEAALLRHPKVLEAAVVGRDDEEHTDDDEDQQQHQIPVAFVKLKEGCACSSQEIMDFCRDNLASHMVPHEVIFGDLPVNSTGKVQKFVLRFRANAT